MTPTLEKWIEDNKLVVSELSLPNGSDIIEIEEVGKFLYLQPFDGKVIDEDFAFILSDEEFDLVDSKQVNYILFEFGEKFYYSGLKTSKNRYNEIIYKPEFNDFKYLGKSSEPTVMEFVHLGVHDEYELLNGSSPAEEWVKKAKFLGHKALGVCDRNTLAGTLAFQTFCKKMDVKPIIGETVTVAKNYNASVDIQETFELKLYALNEKGWKNLLLVNKAMNVDHNGFIPDTELYSLGEGICCVVPKESEFNYVKDDRKAVLKLIGIYKKSFDKVYYQIDTVEYTSSQLFRKHLENIDAYLCKYRTKIPPILINDSYYVDEEESDLKEMLNKVSGKASAEAHNQYYKSVSEIISAYEEWLENTEPLLEAIVTGIENTVKVADACDFSINTGERKLPKFEVRDVEGTFFQEVERGINERLSDKKGEELDTYLERVEKECGVIVPNGLCDYFMILWDIMKWCRDNDINTGPGRGSVCGSLIAYLLYITDVDPLKYDLMFERFLNETRVSGERAKSADSMPDIDVDFPTKYRDDVKEYIKNKYGYAYTCSIGTYAGMKLKTCLKDFAKIKGLPFDLMNKLTKEIDNQIEYSWGDLIEYASKSKSLFKFVQENPEIIHLTKFALLQPKAASVHPSAVVIVPKEDLRGNKTNIFEWMPIKKIDGVLVSEWEGKYIDKSGFLKEDILGLSQLDKFKGILTLIKQNRKKSIDVNKIAFDDTEVFKYFKRGWCEDVFQFGTMGLMNYCRQVKPDQLDHLISMTSLFRPGPMESNAHAEFADIKNGKKKPHYDFGLKEVTESTSGLYIFQEQIMKAVNVLGGLTLVQADQLRTYMKKKDKKAMAALGEQFLEGAMKKGCSKKEAEEIWSKLDKFSGYGFNKCIDGDEKIQILKGSYIESNITIAEMYKIKNMTIQQAKESSKISLRNRYNRNGYGTCFSLTTDGKLQKNKIVDIRQVGKRYCYKITTECFRTINVTLNHKFPTPKGIKLVEELEIGDLLYCKKVGSLLANKEKIINIERIGEKEVYDVEVSGEVSHTFVTSEGIVTSNSHAAAYSIMSYWSQWFKVNYPLEFWTTSLQESEETDIPFRLAEMKKTGVEIEIRPPDVNFSNSNFTCDPTENRIFFSLGKIKGLGDVAVKNIIETREKGGEFFSLEEFLSRVPSKVNKTVVKCLIIAGAFDLLENIKAPRDRRNLLETYLKMKNDVLPEKYQTNEAKTSNSFWVFEQKSLTGFGEVDYEGLISDSIPNKRLAKLYVTGLEFNNAKEGDEVAIAGKVIAGAERQIKNGLLVTFNLDSNNTIIPVTLWPDAYERIGERLEDIRGKVICVNGRVKKDKFRGLKTLFSDDRTKLYIIS
jgi:DNA-directed DNA polymerase III PolC